MDQGSNGANSCEGIKVTINKLLAEGDMQRDFCQLQFEKCFDIKVLGDGKKENES